MPRLADGRTQSQSVCCGSAGDLIRRVQIPTEQLCDLEPVPSLLSASAPLGKRDEDNSRGVFRGRWHSTVTQQRVCARRTNQHRDCPHSPPLTGLPEQQPPLLGPASASSSTGITVLMSRILRGMFL